jgi:hypothetical protein
MKSLRSLAARTAALPFLVLLPACSSFSESTTTQKIGMETNSAVFDATLPDALVETFDLCHGALVVAPWTTTLDPAGTCDTSFPSGASDEAADIIVGLAFSPDIDLSGSFPESVEAALDDVYHVDDPLPFPFQNCDIWLDLNMESSGVALDEFDAEWGKHDGLAAMHLSLDGDDQQLAYGFIEGDVDCNMAWNEPALQPHVPSGPHFLSLDGLELDIWVTFEVVDGAIETGVAVEAELDGLTVSPALDPLVVANVGDIEEILRDFADMDLEDVAAEMADGIGDQLRGSDVPEQLADLLADAAPDGFAITSVSVASRKLTLRSTRDTEPTAVPMDLQQTAPHAWLP